MNKKITLIVSMLLCAALSVAQVREFSVEARNNSIIRSVDDEYVLIYTEKGTGEGYFLLYRDGDPTAKVFQVMSDVHVRDVRIYDGKTAYFCGTHISSDMGVVGKFEILPAFAGTGTVNYGVCNWSTGVYCMKPTDLKRLDLFDSAGVVGMAMVGESKTFLGFLEDGTTVASAWFDGSWHMCAYLNKGNSIHFTDVACLKKSIVAAGNDGTDHGCWIKTYMPALHFIHYNFCYTPGNAQSIKFQSPVGDVLAARAGEDTVLLAHYDNMNNVMTVVHKAKISPATGLPVAPVDTWYTDISSVEPYSSGWKMIELADSGKSSYLLQVAEFPTVSGLDYRLTRIPTIALPPNADYWRPLLGWQQSMDLDAVTYTPRLSGNKSFLLLHGPSWLQHDGGCYEYAPMPVKQASAGVDMVYIHEDDMHPVVITYIDAPDVFDVSAYIICQDSKGKEEKK